jgi:hypothetical protein
MNEGEGVSFTLGRVKNSETEHSSFDWTDETSLFEGQGFWIRFKRLIFLENEYDFKIWATFEHFVIFLKR